MGTPGTPVLWKDNDLQGNPRQWMRLIHVDLLRAYLQNPPARHIDNKKQDTGYLSLKDYNAMRAYIERWIPWRAIEHQERGQEIWISIPTPDSPNWRTRFTQWNTILRRWPQFIDEEAKELTHA